MRLCIFATAFAFSFTYSVGLPDMPAFAKHARHRRKDDAPRIETGPWVQTMSRRIEASLCDWSFGFVTWNYLFRSSLNLSQSFCIRA